MKKIVSIVAVLMLLTVSLTLAGCGTKQNQKTDSDYEAYDGYAYYQANGDLKYSLDTKDGLKMHCFFQEGSPEYIEEIYTIDPVSYTHLEKTDRTGTDDEHFICRCGLCLPADIESYCKGFCQCQLL